MSCFHVIWDKLPLTTREMHLSFENLVFSDTSSLQASLMDIHHDTSFKSILKDDSISFTSKAYICSCSIKKVGLYLIVKPSIHLFCIAHFTFTSMMYFCLGLIQPSTFNFFMCECGQGLDTSSMHLAHCLFGGQQITKHDTIRNVMYAFT
jgi:hypothetical protein